MKSKYKEIDSSNLTASEREEFFRGSLKTIHENKNDLEQFYTKESIIEKMKIPTLMNNLKLSVLSLPKYRNEWGYVVENENGEYIKLEDVLNLFSAKNS